MKERPEVVTAIRRMMKPGLSQRRPVWRRVLAIITLWALFEWLGRVWSWTLVGVIIGIVVGFIPLFGVLGFELAVVTAGFAAVMGLDVGAALARELARMPAPGVTRAIGAGRMVRGSSLAAAGLAIAIALVPAAICAVRGIWVPTCDWWFGVTTYAALPLASAALGAMFGHAIGIVVGPRRFVCAIVALLPVPLLVAAGLWRFYSEPPVFVYSPLIGYFPGNMYDENIQLHLPLLWSRLEQLAWVIAALAIVSLWLDAPRFRLARAPRPAGRRIGAVALAVVSLAAAIVLRLQSGSLGYAIDADDIADALGGRIDTEHFVIYYDASRHDIADEIDVIARDHEFRLAQVVARLGVAPDHKLVSFYFASPAQKAELFGARHVEMAKPWRGEVYVDHLGFPQPALRHELAHAVAGEFGDPLFGVSAHRILGLPLLVSPGLVEGLAVAVDWPDNAPLTPHEAVRALIEMDEKPSLRQLMGLSFFGVSSARGYTTAGSFVKFLLDTYGAAALREVYPDGDFEHAYGMSLDELEVKWLAMIRTIELPKQAVEATRERFRGSGVFAKPCPHAIALRVDRARVAQGRGDHDAAVTLLRDVCSEAPGEPDHLLDLAKVLDEGGVIDQLEAARIWTDIAADTEHVTSSLRARALEGLARTAGASGDLAKTRAYLDEAAKLPLDVVERRQVVAEQLALDHTGPAGDALRNYFWGSTLDPAKWAALAAAMEPSFGYARYLNGLQREAARDWVGTAAELDSALSLGLPGIAFVRNAARKLAVAGYRTHDRERVERAIAALADPQMSAVDRALADDWHARLVFDATGKLPATSR